MLEDLNQHDVGLAEEGAGRRGESAAGTASVGARSRPPPTPGLVLGAEIDDDVRHVRPDALPLFRGKETPFGAHGILEELYSEEAHLGRRTGREEGEAERPGRRGRACDSGKGQGRVRGGAARARSLSLCPPSRRPSGQWRRVAALRGGAALWGMEHSPGLRLSRGSGLPWSRHPARWRGRGEAARG